MKLYEIDNLTFAYPDIASERDDVYLKPVLKDIGLSIEKGSFVIVAGGSGSGKTTLLRQLKSVLTPRGKREGTVCFQGKKLGDIDDRVQTEQIGFVVQDVDAQLVTDKVWHELAFGLESLGYDNAFIQKRVAEMCSFFGLDGIFHKKVNELSGGQKQLVNLASVMAMAPEVVILDEPASQLDPMAAREFFQCLYRINRELGTTVILTEHRLEEIWPMCSQFILMEDGRVIYDGSIADGVVLLAQNAPAIEIPAACRIAFGLSGYGVSDCPVTVAEGREWLRQYDEDHEQAMAKGQAERADTQGKNQTAENVIDIKDVFFHYPSMEKEVLSGLTLSVKRQEILAINGTNGCGKSTLLSLIAGNYRPDRGRIRRKKQLRIGYLPQDPKLLFTANTVGEELGLIRRHGTFEVAEQEISKEMIWKSIHFCRLESVLTQHPYDLSGGEQQRLGLAKVLLAAPDVILMDEPTKGMDAAFKKRFSHMMKKLKASGHTIVMVSHDIEFCAETADRICLIFDGRVATVAGTNDYFSGNEFYTTAAARIAKGTIRGAVTVEDILHAYGKTGAWDYPDDDIDDGTAWTDAGNRQENDEVEPEEDRIGSGAQSEISIQEKKTEKMSFVRKLGLLITTVIMVFCFYKTMTQADLTRLIENGAVTGEGIQYLILYGIFILATVVYILLLRPVGRNRDQDIDLRRRNRISRKKLIITVLCIALVVGTIWFGKTVLSDRKYYFISLLVLIEMMIPFLTAFETKALGARDIVTVAVLCALATVGRTAFFMIPNFNPVMAIVIISGVAFGCETGFVTGAVTMLVSNMVFGQGPWTPWQMFSLGLVGFAAGLVFNNSRVRSQNVTKLGLCIFGGLCCILIYGGIMNPASVIMWQPAVNLKMIVAAYVTGFPFDVVQGFATVLFLWIMARPFLLKLDRIKVKYGVLCEVKQHA